METEHFTDLAKVRIAIAKEYLDKLKEKMGDGLVGAYLYGSTVKNCPKENSDIDIILIAKKPSQEERIFINSIEGGLFDPERQGSINFAKNSHYLFVFLRELKKKYGIDISPYYHFVEDDATVKVRAAPFYLADILKGPVLKYPEDFKNIAYV